jgi:hypothetical protein
MNRDFPAIQAFDPGRVHIHADHVISGIRKTGPCDEAHISRTKDRNAHA